MSIVLMRIDDRLIHGQVVEGWIPVLKPVRVLVISDEAAADPMQKQLMRLALPENIALEVLSVAGAHGSVRKAVESQERTLVLAPGPSDVLALIEAGAVFDKVNVGGLHHAAGRERIGRAIFLSADDRRALSSLIARGVRVEGRAVPMEQAEDVGMLLKEGA
ncbi:MAG: PTS sugar transporter subunit IIB [Elusimicrobiota bacterium]|jgi:mannose/fructose/N-acetylgalactosamine-specific phosphotransferase system component IIB